MAKCSGAMRAGRMRVGIRGRIRVGIRGLAWASAAALGLFSGLAPSFAQGTDVAPAPAAAAQAASDTPSGLPVPRFVSLKFDEVNGRTGPSLDHPIRWRYQREGLPVQVVAESEGWRKVRDPDGDEVWMHARTLSARRTAIVAPYAVGPRPVRRRPERAGAVIAQADPGVVFALGRCLDGWCRVEGPRVSGWMRSTDLWGVNPVVREAG